MCEQKEKRNEYTRDHRVGVVACWRPTHLAAQRELGVRPQRRARFGPSDPDYPGPDRSALTASALCAERSLPS